MTSRKIDDFWRECQTRLEGLPDSAPKAWAFNATPEQSDDLLGLVLDGVKPGTASSLWNYEETAEPLPRADHEHFWRNYSENPRGHEPQMPVVCERFRLLWGK